MPAKKGHIVTEKTRQKIRTSLLGKKHTKERIEKNRKSHIGRKWTMSQRRKYKKNHSGPTHYNWKGGRTKDGPNGYIFLYQKGKHPIREHRIVAKNMLKRRLKKGEVVHHINEDRTDNRPKNLCIFKNNNEHLKFHRRKNAKSSR